MNHDAGPPDTSTLATRAVVACASLRDALARLMRLLDAYADEEYGLVYDIAEQLALDLAKVLAEVEGA
jgi:hypothetical protein